MPQLRDVFHQMNHDIIPKCTYCINSGHGLHLYYLLEKPVPLYKHLQDKLREFKYELIAKVWNRYTSTFTEREQVQYQGIFQGFRMVGTQSKLGKRYPVKAFETGERVTIEYLNGYLMDKSKAVTDFHYKSDLSLAEARKKYPEWYEKRIVQGERRERWHVMSFLQTLFPYCSSLMICQMMSITALPSVIYWTPCSFIKRIMSHTVAGKPKEYRLLLCQQANGTEENRLNI